MLLLGCTLTTDPSGKAAKRETLKILYREFATSQLIAEIMQSIMKAKSKNVTNDLQRTKTC
eukprot:5694554-Amphidinium_carterae.1